MRSTFVAAIAALAFATAAGAAPGYHLDAKGQCHAAGGAPVRIEACTSKHCIDPKTRRVVSCHLLRCPLPACCWDNCSGGAGPFPPKASGKIARPASGY